MKLKPREYARRVQRASPPSPLGKDCLWAFFVGGGICLLGEVLRQWYLAKGLEWELAGTLTSCTLVALSALFITLGLYQKLAAKAGCRLRSFLVHHCRAGHRVRHAGGGGVWRGALGDGGHGLNPPRPEYGAEAEKIAIPRRA